MKYFFVGVKGVGMTSIATLYKKWGHEVLGSDTDENFFTDVILRDLGIQIVSFSEEHITKDIDRVIYSSAYPKDHPQIARAIERRIPVVTYAEALAEIFNERRGILVTGTHGKTTSTAMLGRVLEDAGLDPTVVCGGELIEWKRTARAGSPRARSVAMRGKAGNPDAAVGAGWIVSEGDEYQAKILMLKPEIVFLTNIEYDHPDFYPNEEAYRDVFCTLLKAMPESGIVVAHESTRDLVEKSARAKKIYFGSEKEKIKLTVWGEHNRINALGVLAVAGALGVPRDRVLSTLAGFSGTRRRMELYTPEDAETVIMDDYAHHPTEIRATLRALYEHYPDREITAIFQPHTYSRTYAMLEEFACAFSDATRVIITDIYASAREKEKSVRGEDLFNKTKKRHDNVFFAHNLEEAYATARMLTRPQSVIITLGAGDVWRVAERLSSISASGTTEAASQ